ncbi:MULTISPECIES: hypothetical protein [unclassified Burkholderia]|uniref:hypothetical protein n=1 Tax=unclassified Burkholderia TaxID=2613784 RepID=UPI000F57B110|nr:MULTISPECIES: hypothetical protein [unclassified Burkholderia]
MTIVPIAAHGGVRRIRFGLRLRTAWHQSRKRRGSTVDMGQHDARPATCRRGARLDVNQAVSHFPQQN